VVLPIAIYIEFFERFVLRVSSPDSVGLLLGLASVVIGLSLFLEGIHATSFSNAHQSLT
jgi:hypothetical protein